MRVPRLIDLRLLHREILCLCNPVARGVEPLGIDGGIGRAHDAIAEIAQPLLNRNVVRFHPLRAAQVELGAVLREERRGGSVPPVDARDRVVE